MVLAEYERAEAAYQRALELIRLTVDRRGEIDILVGLSRIYLNSHREAPANASIEQALALAREMGDRAFEALCLTRRVSLRSSEYGPRADTTSDAEEALRLARDIGDPQLVAEALIALGRVLQWCAVFDRSLGYLHEGVELARRTHAGSQFGQAAFWIGNAYTAQGAYEDALRWYQQLSDYAGKAGTRFKSPASPTSSVASTLSSSTSTKHCDSTWRGTRWRSGFSPGQSRAPMPW